MSVSCPVSFSVSVLHSLWRMRQIPLCHSTMAPHHCDGKSATLVLIRYDVVGVFLNVGMINRSHGS
ncbi:hypothetical protein A2U01_0051173 [Trifolium medium]|uniref:Uncharacterized protein n=1 Tax=Trifolium medium TaxID=97028 RepID=A0A392R1I3_9FABA|nr:hypothetical protein [Trifolium medium]